MSQRTKYSFLTHEEYLRMLLSKEEPTDADLEAAQRIELLLASQEALLAAIARAVDLGRMRQLSAKDALDAVEAAVTRRPGGSAGARPH